MDRLEAMTAFVTVAELRGFAPAARRMRVSPSAVTRLVAALEERLGARLLQRTTRSVTLTDAGACYLERARRVLADVAEADAAVQAERSVPAGRFVVTASNVFGRMHVAPLMSAFLARHPKVTGVLVLTDNVTNLVEEGIDAAVRIGRLEDSSNVAVSVGATRRVVVAAPKYLAAHAKRNRKKLRAPDDLAAHAIILHTALTPLPEWRFANPRGGDELRVNVTPAFTTNSADAAVGHAERGGGVAMVLGYQVAEAVRARRLEIVLADYEPEPLPIHVLYPSTRLLSANVRAFVEAVKEEGRGWAG